jgi:hypothetical protein
LARSLRSIAKNSLGTACITPPISRMKHYNKVL